MGQENKDKRIAGLNAQKSLCSQIQYLKENGFIETFEEKKKYGHIGLRDDQFVCDFSVTFRNKETWILFSTTSLRTDRFKAKQWDSFNIKIIDPKIQKAFIICTDDDNEIENFCNNHASNKDLLYVDGILSQEGFFHLIDDKILGSVLNGRKAAKVGLNFQSLLGMILKNEQNLRKYQGSKKSIGILYNNFKIVLQKLLEKDGNSQSDIKDISASTKIPDLPQYTYEDGTTKKGGKAKTDLLLSVKFKDQDLKKYTISCKNIQANKATVFEFPPKYCAEILSKAGLSKNEKNKLELLLDKFLECGGPTLMSKEDAQQLENLLKPHLDFFQKWALRGTDKHYSNPDQLADYIVTRKSGENEYFIETIEECIQRLTTKHFGTIFGWTVTKTDKKTKKKNIRLTISE